MIHPAFWCITLINTAAKKIGSFNHPIFKSIYSIKPYTKLILLPHSKKYQQTINFLTNSPYRTIHIVLDRRTYCLKCHFMSFEYLQENQRVNNKSYTRDRFKIKKMVPFKWVSRIDSSSTTLCTTWTFFNWKNWSTNM